MWYFCFYEFILLYLLFGSFDYILLIDLGRQRRYSPTLSLSLWQWTPWSILPPASPRTTGTECFIYYRKYMLKITQPSQYRRTQLQYRFAVMSEAPSMRWTLRARDEPHREKNPGEQHKRLLLGYTHSISFTGGAFTYTATPPGPLRLLSVPKCTANLYCICLSIDLWYT